MLENWKKKKILHWMEMFKGQFQIKLLTENTIKKYLT